MKIRKEEGFIPISRKLFNNFLWKEEREFSRAEAWLDLLQLARFEANPAKEIINGRVIEYNRGERPLSLRLLADRWKWSKNRVDKFLDLLVKERMIAKKTSFGTALGTGKGTTKSTGKGTAQTIITICNYDSYNSKPQKEGHLAGQLPGQHEGQLPGQSRDNINKENNITPTQAGAYTCEAEMDLMECYNSLLNSPIWYESFCMNNHLTLQQFADYLKQFFVELQNRGETSKSEKDAKYHFASWYKLNKNRNNETDRKHSKADKTRNLVTELAAYSEGGTSSLPDEEVLNW